MQTIIYRCGLMLIFTISVSISSASVTIALNCVKACADVSQKISPEVIESEELIDLAVPPGIHLIIAN
jgi:hypothetical protein